MSSTQYTFGGNTNRGSAFWVYDRINSNWTIFRTDDLANPYTSSLGLSQVNTLAFGKDKIVHQYYTTRPFAYQMKEFNDRPNNLVASYMDISQTESLTNNYPYTISFGNDMWMSLPFRLADPAVAGDVRTSINGDVFTTYPGVLPSATGFLAPAVYNPDDGRWATCTINSTSIYYSDDNGATWSTATAPVAVRAVAYGNGTWVFSAGSNGAVYSSNNLTTMTQVTGLNTNYNIHYNEWDQTFWIGAGFYTGSEFNARIYSSTDGIVWTTRYSGTAPFLVQGMIGDDSGNYVAMGIAYSGAYVATNVYLYSTDNGANWAQGTLPVARQLDYSQSQMTWGSLKRGTPPAGSPPAPTFSLSVDRTEANEGDTITWTLYTTNVSDGTTLYYTLVVDPFDGYSDFTDNLYQGSFVVNSNTATIQKTVTADSATEGTETVEVSIRTGSISGPILVTSDPVTIYDTSVYVPPPPPAQTQPTITAGASQSFSVPRSVYKNETIEYSVQFSNATPYNYTVDVKQVGTYYNISDGDVRYTFEIAANTAVTQVITETFPKGYTAAEAPNWNQTLAADARGAPGTPNTYTINVSRTPYNVAVSPPSGSSFSVPATINLVFTGGEPNSYLSYSGSTNGTVQFDGSGSYTFANLSPGNQQPQTYSWTITLSDGSSFPYTLYFTN
jgi:hypothetical protein